MAIGYQCQMRLIFFPSVDSIYVLSIKFDIDFPFSLTRERFGEYFYDDGKYDIVTDRNKINEICKLLKDLKPLSTDNIKCNIINTAI